MSVEQIQASAEVFSAGFRSECARVCRGNRSGGVFGWEFSRTQTACAHWLWADDCRHVLYGLALLSRVPAGRFPKTRAGRASSNSSAASLRQRDLLRSVWRWYLGPLIPDWPCCWQRPSTMQFKRAEHSGCLRCALCCSRCGVFFGIARLNGGGAKAAVPN